MSILDDAARATSSPPATRFRSNAAPDRFMRRLLGVTEADSASGVGAHAAFRVSVMFSGVRCLITYLLIPVLVPVLSLAGWVAAPIGIALCVYAVVNGIVSMKRFWRSDHRQRWMYTGFMAVVFVVLGVALVSDLSRLGGMS
ncbi:MULTISPECIES: HIG1 domain-containing protein [unclassified Tessaracoccus]|uniref:HIG1 domain-containing protein n=1 Tax=unclassified Tessaracoccus TaxID=2635419 RepID=UPI0018E90C38|nr:MULTISPECIES: HIG1 domain-containing protein [unclassified Tessaracoccus]